VQGTASLLKQGHDEINCNVRSSKAQGDNGEREGSNGMS